MATALANKQARGYFDARLNAVVVNVAPGAHDSSRAPGEVLSTVLGSCVCACLRDPDLGLGGLNHFLLPGDDTAREGNLTHADLRFGDAAMEVLINSLMRQGANRRRLEAKVFGGARVLAGSTQFHVGQRNADFVLRFLANEGIRVLAHDLGGERPRRAYFQPHSGRAWVHLTDARATRDVLAQETRYQGEVRQQPKAGNWELF
jgi:chemotaxis protein CheD